MRTNFQSVLRDVMERNGVTTEQLNEKVNGSADNKDGLKTINQVLTFMQYSKTKVEGLVRAAGGTDEEVAKAGVIAKTYAAEVGEIDTLRETKRTAAIEAVESECDDLYKAKAADLYNRGDELVAEDLAKKAAAAKKAAGKEKKEAQIDLGILDAEAPVAESKVEGLDDPFDEN